MRTFKAAAGAPLEGSRGLKQAELFPFFLYPKVLVRRECLE